MKIDSKNETNSMELLYSMHRFVFEFDRVSDLSLQNQLKITLSQFMIMMAISYCPNSTQKEISKYLNLTQAAVSRQIQNLCTINYLLRIENPQSRREHIMILTKNGEETLKDATKVLSLLLEDKFKIISSKDKKTIIQSIQKLF